MRPAIQARMKEKELSVRKLAEISGVRRQSIAHFLRGGNLHLDNLEKMLAALEFQIQFTEQNKNRKEKGTSILAHRLPLSKEHLIRFCKKHGIILFAIFGSVLKNDFKKGSDIDILIDLKETVSFFELAGLEEELKKLLRTTHKLDLLTKKSISPFLKEKILEECQILYEEAA